MVEATKPKTEIILATNLHKDRIFIPSIIIDGVDYRLKSYRSKKSAQKTLVSIAKNAAIDRQCKITGVDNSEMHELQISSANGKLVAAFVLEFDSIDYFRSCLALIEVDGYKP